MDHVQILGEQIRTGQRLGAFETLQKMRVLHEAVFPPGGDLDWSAVEALRSLGGVALASGDRSGALELYSRAADALPSVVESGPWNADSWRDLANVLVEAERYPEAIRVYLRLIELAPDHARYRIRLARAYRANGQVDEAIAVLEQAIELAPGESRPLLELGNTYLLLERMNEAVAAYGSVLEVDNKIVEAQFGLAQAHDGLGQTDQAVQEYEAVIEIDPEHWLAEQARERLAELDQ
jgi:tetratricopeptide (TPR) repeat protein